MARPVTTRGNGFSWLGTRGTAANPLRHVAVWPGLKRVGLPLRDRARDGSSLLKPDRPSPLGHRMVTLGAVAGTPIASTRSLRRQCSGRALLPSKISRWCTIRAARRLSSAHQRPILRGSPEVMSGIDGGGVTPSLGLLQAIAAGRLLPMRE